MKIAKKIFFIILIILVVLFSTYVVYEAATKVCGLDSCKATDHSWYQNYTDSSKFITSSNPDNWTLGKTMGLGLCDVESYTTWNGTLIHKGRFKQDFLMRGNKDFYCIESGQRLSTGEYQYVARIDIDENNAVLTRYGATGTIQGANTGDARESTRELVEILKQAKVATNSKSTYTDRDGEHANVGTQYLRERGEHYTSNTYIYEDFSFKYDVYQRVVWKHLTLWRNTVFESSKLPEIGSKTGSDINTSREDKDLLYAAEYEATQIFNNVYGSVNDTSIRETGVAITDNSLDNIKNKELSTSTKYENYTILGPFKYDYKGTARVNIYFNGNTSNSNASVSIGTWNGSTFTGVSTLPDNSNFYVKVPTNYLTSSIKTLNIDVEVNSTEEKTTLYILKSVNDTSQNVMYVKQTSTPLETAGKFSYDIETLKTVTLEKKSTEGQALPNVTFKLYDENGTGKGTYTTNENGKIIIQNLEVGKKYIVEETSNKAYGGRGANIANATISAGGTITSIDKENRKITFKLTDNATLVITNTIDLGKITIRKIDNTSGKEIKLKDVEFVLWDMTVGWVSLYDKNTGKYIDKIDKTNEINLLDYVIKQSNEDNLPTKFVTNSNGEIVINNLQIKYSIDKKNCFLVSEVTNNNYGYKGMILESGNIVMSTDNTRIIKEGSIEIQNGELVKFEQTESCIRQKDKSVKFNIDQNAILTIKNEPKLGDLQIIKTGENSVPLPNVKFAVWQEGKGFIRLTDAAFKQEIVSANNIDLLKYKIDYTENQKEATKFVTNSEGIINITNFEVYSGVDSEGNAIPNVYVVREVENPNYGYRAMILEENKVTINEKPIGANNLSSSIDEEKREIKFTMQGDTEINIENIPQFSNLTIEKVGGDGKTKQQNVEFVIWQLSGGYVRLYEEKENGLKFLETIDSKLGEPIDFKKYVIGYSASATGEIVPTRFITNELGQIQISNIETYYKSDKNKKNCHFISEVRNDNYGYSAKIIEDATIIDGEFIEFDNEESYIRQKDSAVKFNLGKNTILTIKNKPQLGNLLIKKENTEGEAISNVEFELWQHLKGGYVRLFEEKEYGLKFVDRLMSEDGKPIDFEKYVVEYVLEVTENTLPTRFITNELGEIQINNLETHYNSKLECYFVSEVENNNYGYKGMIIEEATIDGGTLVNFDNTESHIRQIDRAVKFTITENTTLTIKNSPQLGEVLINKESTDGSVLQNVEFIIRRGENEYVVIKDSNGNNLNPNNIDATAIIDIDGQFENNEYTITYSTDKDKATVFITGEEGTIDVRNLEIYKPYVISRPKIGSTEIVDAQPVSYNYTIQEISNPNYGYALTNQENLLVTIDTLNSDETTQVIVQNELLVRNLEIVKQDVDKANIKLANVGFVIYTTTEGNSRKGYLSVYDENNVFQKKINKEITINDGYRLEYNYFYDEYENLDENQQAEITIFETNNIGKININNLEVYERETAKIYQYQLVEVYNENFGYEIDNESIETIVLKKQNEEESDTKSVTVLNKQVYVKISGYVWEEFRDPKKSSVSDLLYEESESSKDIKLTDLYVRDEEKGIYKQNPNAEIPVKILLRNKETGETREPDNFIYKSNASKEKIEDAGKYIFEVEIAKLTDYEIVFEYDGFYYSTIIPNTQATNGSKAVENEEDRTELNNKFGTIESGDKIVSSDRETENRVVYDEVKEKKSSLLGFEDENLTQIKAETIINLSQMFSNAKDNSEVPVEGIDNINMGLAKREQPILWITSSINNVEVNLKVDNEEHEYNYDYSDAEIQTFNEEYYYNEEEGEYKSVKGDVEKTLIDKLIQESQIPSFKAQLVKSDIQAVKFGKNEENKEIEMGVSAIYKISLNNSSGQLTSVVHEVKNYFDARFTIEEIGLSIKNKQIENIIYREGQEENGLVNIVIEENVYVENSDEISEKLVYNSAIIPLGEEGITLESLATRPLYIKYKLKEEYIEKLLKEDIICNNATEIIKYSSYYEETLGKGLIKIAENQNAMGDILTENQDASRIGQIYAGINLGNRPDNIKLKLVKNGENTAWIFDTSEYEVDSTATPAIIICADGVRTISGTIFEDKATVINNEKNGDGKYDPNVDLLISNVKVELYKVDDNGAIVLDGDKPITAKYVNGIPIVTEAINGKYTLGEYTDAEGNTYGILPGKYIIQYTYGSYTNEENQKKQTCVVSIHEGKTKYINMMDYKSTMIPEESGLKEEFKKSLKKEDTNGTWFIAKKEGNYSTAVDNLLLRPEYIEHITSVRNGNIRGKGIPMGPLGETEERQKMETDAMVAKTLPLEVNMYFTENNEVNGDENGQIQQEKLNEKLENINLGIVERPNIDIKIDKKITNIEVIAQNGASIIPKGDPRGSNMQYITAINEEEAITAQIDPKLLQGATLNVEYTVTVENNSNIDYICEEYYHFGEKNEEFKNTPTAQLVVDYLDLTTKIDETRAENEVWQKKSATDLKNEEYIDTYVYDALTSNGKGEKYYAYITSAFKDVKIGDEPKSEKMYVTKNLSISEDIKEEGRVEIIEVGGRRTITGATPGNYNPDEKTGEKENTDYLNERDWDKDSVKFMPPTGIVVYYKMYMIAILAMFTILIIGIVVIKKKIIV